jgi:hypothetical protein
LCAELLGYVEDRPARAVAPGALLPGGEGIAFRALGEIVKAECGIRVRLARRSSGEAGAGVAGTIETVAG